MNKSYFTQRYLYQKANVQIWFFPYQAILCEVSQSRIRLSKLSTGTRHSIEIKNISPISLKGRFDTIQEKLELKYICRNNTNPFVLTISAKGLSVNCVESKPKCLLDDVDVTDKCENQSYHLSIFSNFEFNKLYDQLPQISFGKHKKLDVYRVVSDADIEEFLPVLFRASCHVNEQINAIKNDQINVDNAIPFIKPKDSPDHLKLIFFEMFRSLTVPLTDRFYDISWSIDVNRNYTSLYLGLYDWVLNSFAYQSSEGDLVLFEVGFSFFPSGKIQNIRLKNTTIKLITWRSKKIRQVTIYQERSERLKLKLPACYRSVRCQMNNQKYVLQIDSGVVTVDLEPGLIIFDRFTK
jgi:hypothetical protein